MPRPGGIPVKKLLRAFWPPLVWGALIWLIGGMESTPSGPDVPGLDKVAHFAMYGVLGFLLGRAWVVAGRGWSWVLPVTIALALGAVDEWRQSALPTRSSEVADWMADAAGVVIGFGAGVALTRRKKTNRD